ncbi:Light-sensor Protein kinase [Ceratobasidium sp. 428]|nr:Light-sensor Protein kinase [Ceratobasidium sp. 428]
MNTSSGGYPDPNQFDDDDADTTSPLIVLEFELERDVFNPLYPPYTAALPIDSPGVSSRGTGSAGTPGSRGTGSTPMSQGTPGSAGTGSAGTGGTGQSSVTQQQETPKQQDHQGGKSAPALISGSSKIWPQSWSYQVWCWCWWAHQFWSQWPWLWFCCPWLGLCWILSLFIPAQFIFSPFTPVRLVLSAFAPVHRILTRLSAPFITAGNEKDEEEGLPTEEKDVPTGTGGDAIAGTSAEEGKTGKTAGEGMTEGEIVVPVVVGRAEDDGKGESKEEDTQPDQTTPTAVPTSTPAPEEGTVTSPQSGTGMSSGDQTVTSGDSNVSGMKGTVTDPSSEVTPTANNPGSGGNELSPTELRGLVGEEDWYPSADDVLESTTSRSRPLRALERMRRITREPPGPRRGGRGAGGGGGGGGGGGVGTMDVFAVLAQVNDQLGNAPDLESFLKVVVGVIKDLTQFHRVLVYQFDEQWNGQCVAELVDWSQTHDIFKGLHFPAADIPAQARELYTINKVRLLYDRSQTTARLVVRDRSDLETPLVSQRDVEGGGGEREVGLGWG